MKNLLITAFFLMYNVVSFSQGIDKILYSVFVTQKNVDGFTDQRNYQVRMISGTIESDLRNEIIKQEKKAQSSYGERVEVKTLYLRKGDYAIIIGVKYDYKTGQGEHIQKIYAFKTNTLENLDEQIKKEIFVMRGMISKYYVSHEILRQDNPFKDDDNDLIEILYDWLKGKITEEKRNELRQIDAAPTVGVRG